MLISQFDKFVNRSTREILGSEIEQENLEPMLSTDIVRAVGGVTGVKGEKEVYYRTGNVNLTSADIGALDEDNVYNGLDQTDPGYALDARQGKVLGDSIDDKLDKANVYNGLDQTESGYALDARQGKALDDAIDNKLNKANVYNGLDQTDPGYALDARQGKVLADKLDAMAAYTPLLEINSNAPTTATSYTFSENVSKFMFIVIVGAWMNINNVSTYLIIPSFCWVSNASDDIRLYLNNNQSNAYAALNYRTNTECKIKCSDANYRLTIYGFMPK